MKSLQDRGSGAFDALAVGLVSENAETRSRSRRVVESIVAKAILPGSVETLQVYFGEIAGEHLEQSLQDLLADSPQARQERIAVLQKYREIEKKHPGSNHLNEQVDQSLYNLKDTKAYCGSIYLVLAGSKRTRSERDAKDPSISYEQVESLRKSGINYLVKALTADPEIYTARAFDSNARFFGAGADPEFRAAVKLAHEKDGKKITDADITVKYSSLVTDFERP